MPQYTVPLRVTYLDTVTVEADSPEEAKRLAVNVDDVENWDHDVDPEIVVCGAPELVEDDEPLTMQDIDDQEMDLRRRERLEE